MKGKYKVVITARSFGQISNEPFKILEENHCEVFKSKTDKPLTSEELIPLIEDADVMIVGNDEVNKAVIEAAKKVKVISRYGVGYDNIDLAAADQKGIVVTNTPNTNDNSVADLAFSLILSLSRKIPETNQLVKEGKWNRLMGTEIWGKTLGVVGLGCIGKGLVQRAKGFNMDVLCYDVVRDEEYAKANNIRYCSLEELLRLADAISIHVPLLPATKGLIGEKELAMMKSKAYLVNTARGGIIDEVALYHALKDKKIAGAGLDVLEDEPPKDSPLLTLDNIIITSHVGGYTEDAVNNMGITAARNVVFVLNNEPGAYIVNSSTEIRRNIG